MALYDVQLVFDKDAVISAHINERREVKTSSLLGLNAVLQTDDANMVMEMTAQPWTVQSTGPRWNMSLDVHIAGPTAALPPPERPRFWRDLWRYVRRWPNVPYIY